MSAEYVVFVLLKIIRIEFQISNYYRYLALVTSNHAMM